MKKQVAEFIGTFTLVLFGCGSAVIAGGDIGLTGISFAFGLALIGMAYGIGAVSGCHINPAVSLGAVAAGRMTMGEAINYMIAQVAGAIVAALVLLLINGRTCRFCRARDWLGAGRHSPCWYQRHRCFREPRTVNWTSTFCRHDCDFTALAVHRRPRDRRSCRRTFV